MEGPYDHLVLGDNNAICQVCGQKTKASKLRRRWDGYLVDAKCWHPRQPQDFVRAVPENLRATVTSPEPPDIFINVYCTIESSYSIAGDSISGCWVAGKTIEGEFGGV